MASKFKVMMRCSQPVMNADGTVAYQPGDLLPEGHPDTDSLAWAPFIVDADVPKASEPDPKPESKPDLGSDPKPVPTPPPSAQ